MSVKARKDAGQLTAKLVIPLAGYDSERVKVRLDDSDSNPIALEVVGSLAPVGTSGMKWQLKTKALGIQNIQLKMLPKAPGTASLAVKAKRWFSAAAANQPAGDTVLKVTIGSECFSTPATKKTD